MRVIQGGVVPWRNQGLLVKAVLVLCTGLFIGQLAGGSGLERVLRLSRESLADGQIWRLVTYAFLHGGVWHLAFNLLVLWMLVPGLAARVGEGRLAMIAGLAVIAGGLAHCAFSIVPVIGISGAIYAVLVLTAWFWPRQRVLVFFVFPMPMYLFVLVLAGMEILMTMQPGSMTAHWAHLGGAVMGLLAGVWISGRGESRRQSPQTSLKNRIGFFFWKRKLAKRNAEQARVDELLDKISRTGIGSLSARERRFLDRASGKYRTD